MRNIKRVLFIARWLTTDIRGHVLQTGVQGCAVDTELLLFFFCLGLGVASSDQPTTVPGVGGGAGEVGGVGLPESTGGQGRIDWLALPATAQRRGERRQQLVPCSLNVLLSPVGTISPYGQFHSVIRAISS